MKSIFWFRRDLRLFDNHGLFEALNSSKTVYPIFIFDPSILDKLPTKSDKRVQLIWDALSDINSQLEKYNTRLSIFYGQPDEIIPKLSHLWNTSSVFTNEDYEPNTIHRDQKVSRILLTQNTTLHILKDHVIFHKNEIVKSDGSPYVVFTPYSKAWKASLNNSHYQLFPSENFLFKIKTPPLTDFSLINSLNEIGFQNIAVSFHGSRENGLGFLTDFSNRINSYDDFRNYPAQKGVSYLSPFLRFGLISIRECVRLAISNKSVGAEKWLNELIWRDFYSQILFNFPHVVEGPFQTKYNSIQFPFDDQKWSAWCNGKTGFPIVDAAMHQLNQTGWMHNRLRMVVASFLIKDLHIDWRLGEKYFADLLLDFDLASNNGGWQWAASTGCDAQPYFRIFNPLLQSQKFDPDGHFIKKYLPSLSSVSKKFIHEPFTDPKFSDSLFSNHILDYPKPIVDHANVKPITLSIYQSSKQ